MATIEENYVEKFENAVVKTLLDALENLTIEDINMYQIGYNKAIDEFAGKLKDSLIHNYRQFLTVDTDGFEWLTTDAVGTHIDEIAEQLKAGAV